MFPGSEPSLRLVWAQNQPNRQNTGYFAGIPGKTRVYLEKARDVAGFLDFASDFAPDQLSVTQTQGKSRVSRMEHQTPSVFPGNFRKRKVLGPLCFPFCLPEKYIQAKGELLTGFAYCG